MNTRKIFSLGGALLLMLLTDCTLSNSENDENDLQHLAPENFPVLINNVSVDIPCSTEDLSTEIVNGNNSPIAIHTINLEAGCVYEIDTIRFTGTGTIGDFGLPEVTSRIVIHGNGATLHIMPSSGADRIRGFYVAANGSLRLDNLIFTRGPSTNAVQHGGYRGGAILNSGSLYVEHVDFIEIMASQGGAIFNDGFLSVNNSNFNNNHGKDGGAIYTEGSAEITLSEFNGNFGGRQGGAILLSGGDLTITDCIFDSNDVSGGMAGMLGGGAIYNSQGSLFVESSTFSNNSTVLTGGAISNTGDAVINDSVFTNNSARHSGALAHRVGYLEVHTTTFSGNLAGQLGGAIGVGNQGIATIDSSLITDNRCTYGGAVYTLAGTDTTLINTSVTENTISLGGVNNGYSIVTNGSMTIIYSTIANNYGVSSGILVAPGGQLLIQNSIVANNTLDCEIQGIFTALDQNLDADGTCTGFTLSDDPLLGPLADNGGPTMTIALLPGSPALDTALGGCPATDQRGLGRPAGIACDLGAYEEGALVPTATPEIPPPPTETPTPLPQTADLPRVELLRDALCWGGPGPLYPVVQSLAVGVQTEVAGVGFNPGWLVIYSPLYEGAVCWVPEDFIIPIDPLGDLPVFRAPPLPTPTPPPTREPGEEEQGCLVGGPQTAPICIFPCPDWDANPNACTPP